MTGMIDIILFQKVDQMLTACRPQSISEKFQTKEFQAAFPLLCDLESINKDTQQYLKWTQDTMTMVMEIFKDNT